MACEDVLKVSNLPKELSDAEKEDFLRHFGATKVKIITSHYRQKSVAYARFESKEVAREVLFRLHQIYVLKNRLSVEYADLDIGPPKTREVEAITTTNKEHYKTFIKKLNAFNSSVDFHQPPPPHLRYLYPKANRPTINNIGHALASVPKFYTQVLHLMNKMNLPPPFAVERAVPPPAAAKPAAVPPPQVPPTPVPPPQQISHPQEQTKQKESSSESEFESDDESNPHANEIIPEKRKLPQRKPVKRPKFIKPTPHTPSASTSKPERHEDVFEKSSMQHVHSRIELKVSETALDHKPETAAQENQIVGKIGLRPDPPQPQEEKAPDKSAVISDSELAAGQIAAKDLSVLAVFKNYHPGAPSPRLYVKNIAKNVELKDLEYIYDRYKGSAEGAQDALDIRLMQEGRMKGQAFITLSSTELAQKALEETNGFILKEKPLVVVFARSAPVKK